ncbi:cupredoxin domain-containing protein [Ferruginibacter paludis]|uniref:cupredoxin domain-containing protein n=1 Tax=Ferruginibacter paludis TaxID=1310417 RepID=UPI0025B5026F|nr:cupredoxin domain-containing protein [Ferruginibacter paludis]MDN3655364.1 cupredoxin domain-containing protein [Ferruginibacter paludis]
MKSLISATALITVGLLTGHSCSKSNGNSGYNSSPAPSASADEIQIYNMKFSPATLTVKKGTTVKWKNEDSYAHTATSNDNTTFDTGNIAGGATATYTTTTAGTFDYHCTIHGLSMAGTLVVNP